MEQWKKDVRREPVIVDIDALVPKDHLLRKIEKVMDYDWLYERLHQYYCHDNGRPGTDPVVLIKMVLIQHLFGIPSLRQTYREIQVNLAYRWFLGYGLLDEIPHFATVSYAFCKRFPEELTQEIFEHILNKAINNRMVDPAIVFIDGTHIKASANKKKFQKEQVAKAAKVYSGQLRREVNAEREKLGKKPIEEEDNDQDPPEMTEKTVSTTDPDSGMFVKGEHERQFAYEAHTACDKHGIVLAVEVTAGNVHDSVAWDKVYDEVTGKHEVQFVTMDAGYKTPWIATTPVLAGRKLVLAPILRAGLGMVPGMLALVPSAKVGHIGLFRNEATHEPVEYYCKLPAAIDQRVIVVVDPMLATGGSAVDAISMIKKRGGKKIKFVCIIAAPDGLKNLHEVHPDVQIYVGHLDRCLNEDAYICPGLGDAGDRVFGTK